MAPIPVYWDGEGEDVEDPECYIIGGFHPIILGDVLTAHCPPRQYRILHKLGRGAYATVWLAETLHLPSQRYVALKVCAANADSEHELKIFRHIPHDDSPHVIQLLDSFSVQGPNGSHAIFVHDVVGKPTALMRSLTRNFHFGNVGVGLPTLNDHPIADIFDEVGSPACTIVLPRNQPPTPQTLPAYLVPPISIIDILTMWDPTLHETHLQAEILDLGSAVLVGDQSRPFCTLTRICAPELVFEVAAHSIKPPPTRAGDVWSFACTVYELVLGKPLFGGPCVLPNASLLGRIATFCGEIPPSWRNYWNSREELRGLDISQEVADKGWESRLESLAIKKQ
ncbi:hypothetical protein M413DRAFT_23398 [Hebeloma cylindrosporum]|uniref:non-specific serine/threonine protein kinase n=1 Tax=Hebeloma cylindrosporum TaxID=76867 RepID=A0A0C3CTF7_HEBCY|nr:hypothetical protein M413DRAFT_23398 [Hebeloma cylindrosporum h7]